MAQTNAYSCDDKFIVRPIF